MKIKDLSAEALYFSPVHKDWGSGYGETWEIVYPRGFFEKEDWGEREDEFYPMMNYCYPLPDRLRKDPEEYAALLDKHVPLTLIYLTEDDRYVLALTGGGMDFSWEICYAYMLGGYLPPLYFCQLPALATSFTVWRKRVVAACRRSCLVAKNQVEWQLKDLRALRARYGRKVV
ncbi:MAG: hypothetical protein AB1330_01910 [Bacillota bacterium]